MGPSTTIRFSTGVRPMYAGDAMQLRSGIPTIAELKSLQQTDLYRDHVQFNQGFLRQHADAMAKYGKHWGLDPFKLWSRRWEYPFVADRVIAYGKSQPAGNSLKILDAGSGVTYFPYYMIDKLPNAEFICCDYDSSYAKMFVDINAARGAPKVSFLQAMLQKLPLESQSLDAICCISVLEHTNNYGEIVSEFARVLRPGGLFVLTFDLSLDGKFTLPRPLAEELLSAVAAKFDIAAPVDWNDELDRMKDPQALNTDYIRENEPEYLPWSAPVRAYKAVRDLVGGKGWTAGFRSRTIFCVDAVRKLA